MTNGWRVFVMTALYLATLGVVGVTAVAGVILWYGAGRTHLPLWIGSGPLALPGGTYAAIGLVRH